MPDVDAAIADLYAGPLEQFVAGRTALARSVAADGDDLAAARIKRLPKPTLAAWIVNQVARSHPDEVEALATLGDELRDATADRDRGRLTALDRLRRTRVDALVSDVVAAGEVGGRRVSADAGRRLGETLTAVVMDPDAAAAVRSGRLAQALQYVGFGMVDESGEPADVVELVGRIRSDDGAEPAGGAADAEEPDDELAAAEREVAAAAAEVDRLEARRDAAASAVKEAAAARDPLAAEAQRLDDEIEQLTQERAKVGRRLDAAGSAVEKAEAKLAAVDAELEEAEQQASAARRRRREARGR